MQDDDDDKVRKLLAAAHGTGTLSAQSLATLDVIDVGAQIQAGLGVSIDDVAASEVVLLTMMPDDSASIASAGNTPSVIDGHNFVLEALGASRQSGEVLAHTRYLNGHVLFPYVTLDHAVKMSSANYDPRLGTPLFDQSAVLLGTVIAKAQELAQAGIAVRTVTLLITDGGDYGSKRSTATKIGRRSARRWANPLGRPIPPSKRTRAASPLTTQSMRSSPHGRCSSMTTSSSTNCKQPA